MEDFRVGEIKTFRVLGIREDHEVKWIYLSDGIRDTYRIRPFDYQLEWESSNLPTMIECYVKQISIRGLPLLTQVLKNVLGECYTEEKEEYPFKLAGIKVDLNSGATFYELKDVYGLHHRYYPNSNEPPRIIGDIFNMRFESIEVKDRNRAYLLLSPIPSDQPSTAKPESDPRKESSLGFENDKREFKSSIVFPAGGISADIDQQLLIIAKTIAGFLNKDGGEIFLGVNDSGEVIGIDHEFKFLNSSDKDNFSYQENFDGYENKVRTAVKYFIGNTANSNLSFEFPFLNGLSYCIIKINKVRKPIFLNNIKLYQRAGNMTQLLKGDEISHFVIDRFYQQTNGQSLKPVVDPENLEELPVEEEIIHEEEIKNNEEIPPVQIPPINIPLGNDKIWFYLTFYKDGCWSYQRKAVDSDEVELEIPIKSSLKGERMLMVYENGRVNVVTPFDIIKPRGKNGRRYRTQGKKYMNGWNTSSRLIEVFCAKKNDLIVFNSIDSDGIKWVKAHNISAISVRTLLHLEGNVLVNKRLDAELESVSPLPLDYYHLISSIVLRDNQTSGSLGVKITDKSYQKTFKTLNQLLEKYQGYWEN